LPGTAGFKSGAVQPFQLGRNNFTQITYLFINLCLIYCLAHQGARRGIDALTKDWDRAVVCGLLFAVLVSLWQFISVYTGLPFPADFFYSNAGYNRADSQTMAGLFRINGPFEEPSTLGYTFTGFLLFAWWRYRGQPSALSGLMVAACVFCMLISTSTTAFVGLALFVCFALFDVVSGQVQIFPRTPVAVVSLFIVFAAILAGVALAAGNWPAISLMLDNVIFNKAESTSFQQRAFADLLAIKIFVQTYGLGIGLGSHKANSLLLTLLSNTGLAGLILFCSFAYALLRTRTIPGDRLRAAKRRGALSPFQWGLAGLLVIHVFSNPNFSVLILWLQMGGLLALHASLRRSALAGQDATGVMRRSTLGRGLGLAYPHPRALGNMGEVES
jgi:hypothetical protein